MASRAQARRNRMIAAALAVPLAVALSGCVTPESDGAVRPVATEDGRGQAKPAAIPTAATATPSVGAPVATPAPAVAMVPPPPPTPPQQETDPARLRDFSAWLAHLRTEAKGRGLSPATITAALSNVKPLPRVLELDRKQPELTLTFSQYVGRTVSQTRIENGRQRLATNRELLDRIGTAYGVPPRFIVALWGMETDFGRITGGFPVVSALATLAFDGRRSNYFRKELFDALTIIDQRHISADKMLGSWAGAMGQNQFMPSSFLTFAQDHNGDGRRDIWGTTADVFASTANYLSRSGWQADQGWGRAVRLPPGFDVGLADLASRKPMADWAALGVTAADGSPLPESGMPAALVLPDKVPGTSARAPAPAFLVHDNYHVILKWNRSNLFALAVGHLADGLAEK